MGEKLLFVLCSCLSKIHSVFTLLESPAFMLGMMGIPAKAGVSAPYRWRGQSPALSNGVYSSLNLFGPMGPVPCIICRKAGNSCSGHQFFSCSRVRRFLTLIRYSMAFSSCLDWSSMISKYFPRMDLDSCGWIGE